MNFATRLFDWMTLRSMKHGTVLYSFEAPCCLLPGGVFYKYGDENLRLEMNLVGKCTF